MQKGYTQMALNGKQAPTSLKGPFDGPLCLGERGRSPRYPPLAKWGSRDVVSVKGTQKRSFSLLLNHRDSTSPLKSNQENNPHEKLPKRELNIGNVSQRSGKS